MFLPTEVSAHPPTRLWIRYATGEEGEVDLSDIVGHGVFEPLAHAARFERVSIGDFGRIGWGNGLDLCPDALWFRLTGKRPEEVIEGLRHQSHA